MSNTGGSNAQVPEFTIERITEEHDTSPFDCGNHDLNYWLETHALENDRKRLGTTFVSTREGSRVVHGFYTFCPARIEADGLPETEEYQQLPSRIPIPSFLLARLGVDEEFQGQGLGKRLVRDVLKRVVEISRLAAGRFLVVDAKDESLAGWYEDLGFQPLRNEELRLFISLSELEEAERLADN